MKKKPDNVVFNDQIERYDAALKPYATSVGAPVITPTDSIAWKNISIQKVNHKLKTRYLELKEAYDDMMREYRYNELIYNAKFSFEPIVGQIYHLYQRDNEESFLSLIAPDQCDFKSLGSYYLNAEQIWEKVNEI